MNINKDVDFTDRILLALDKVYDKLIEFKRSKDSPLVILRDGKIVRVKPWEENTEEKEKK